MKKKPSSSKKRTSKLAELQSQLEAALQKLKRAHSQLFNLKAEVDELRRQLPPPPSKGGCIHRTSSGRGNVTIFTPLASALGDQLRASIPAKNYR
jgi:hypothetical protein